MAITPEETESNTAKLGAVKMRLGRQQEILSAYESGNITIGSIIFNYPPALVGLMKTAFAELRTEIIELENAITG